MTKHRIVPVIIMCVLIVIGASVFFIEKKDVQASLCSECGRDIHPNWAFSILQPGHKTETLCCPHCGILTLLAQGVPLVQARATDFVTGKPLPADQAIYVWASDVNHCARPQKVTQFDRQPMELVFDRCFPSVVAFQRQVDAETFVKEHNGEIRNYNEIVQLLKEPPAAH
ncbi:MAG: hypothetical protein PHX83_15540 [Acidobacteriia bacterium]|nr:hypothetical protein [Terriglobia bacterium]